MSDFKLTKSEIRLIKKYCSKASQEELSLLSVYLPQSLMGDRSEACSILQKDESIDGWLSHASGPEDFFDKVDSIGEFASLEVQERFRKECL